MLAKICLFHCLLLSLCYLNDGAEKIIYISVEHPRVTYYNPKFFRYVNLTTVRYGRSNPVYYVGFNFENVVPLDKTIYIEFYFFELLTNQYKPTFIEMHFDWCHLIEKDMFFGAALRGAGMKAPCPHIPGQYILQNMTINPAAIPGGFPFTRGRIYANFTHTKTKIRVGEGYIDMRIATISKKSGQSLFNWSP